MTTETKKPTLQGCSNLFAVAKRLLQVRAEGAGIAKVRDNDVGALLALEPSDVSNWKGGKKVINRFSQYLRLASSTGSSVEALYGVATGQVDHNTVQPVQTPLDLLVPEVQQSGSMLLFFFVKEKLSEKNEKVKDGNVGEILGFVPTETTRWKRGSRLITKIDQIMKLAEVTGTTPFYLYQIASGTIIPESLEKYTFRVEKWLRQPKSTKQKNEDIEKSA